MSGLQMSWQPMVRKSTAPIGLRNLGNSCYLNSVLQCLTYTPPLANFCLNHLHTSSCDTGKVSAGEKKSECPFCIIEKRISRSLSTELALDSPLKINNCLKIFAEHFRHGRQEDAHEFLRYVIDACHNTCLRIKKLQQQRRKGGYIENGNCNQNGNGHTVVKEIFGGALQSQVKCLSCGAESNKVDEMMDISLDVLHSGSVKDALQRFFQPEILDGNNKYKCENCKKFVAARKQMSLLQAPNVLVIQLKRFEGIYGGKIDKSIAFEEVLVLSSYMCKASQDPNPEYTLFGTIVHSGFSADTGHYYAYIKDAMGRWYCCNDSFVSVSSLKEVLSEKVYVLFFSRTKQRPGPSHTGVSVNGAKSNAPNGLHSSKILKFGCLEKPVPTKQNGLPLNSSPSKTSKSPPTPPRKPIVSENSGRKPPKAPAVGCIKIVVHSKESMDKNGHVVSREVKEKPVFSMVDRNGIAKSKTSYAVNGGKMQSSSSQPLIDKNGVGKSESYAAEDALKKKSLTSLSGIDSNGVTKPESGDSSNAERNKSLHVATPLSGDSVGRSEIGYTIDDVRKSAHLSNGNGKLHSFTTDHPVGHHENIKSNGTLTTSSPRKMVGDGCSVDDNTGLKRKFVYEDESILLARDTKSQIKVEEFKELIGREAASFLQSCGWSNKVYEHMQHSRKKLRAQEVGCDASNHLELKRLLIADAKTTFISQIPDSVKGTLIEHLKSFSREKSSSIT